MFAIIPTKREPVKERRAGTGAIAIARARYKLHLNRSRGTHGIRNLNGYRAKER